jgi:hypothetical protein
MRRRRGLVLERDVDRELDAVDVERAFGVLDYVGHGSGALQMKQRLRRAPLNGIVAARAAE